MATNRDEVVTTIRRRLAETGISMAEASKKLGRNQAYLQQFMERGTPKQLPEDVRGELASVLSISEDTLKTGGLTGRRSDTLDGGERADAKLLRVLPAPNLLDLIPVLGSAEGGADGSFYFNGETVDRLPRPPFLAGATHGYALFVVGESMVPRYQPGETVYIHPGKPVTVGSFVLIELKDDDRRLAFIKRLVRRTAKTVFVEQFNPKKTIEIPADRIISLHKIVGSGDS